MKIVIYRRLSKQKSDGQQYGFDSQQADINNFLAQIGDHEVIGDFGEFYSGKALWTNRQQLVKAVELCEETGATLLVSKVDRLGRHVESVAALLNRVNVRIATMPSANNMMIQIMAVMAEEEVRAISARTKAALASAKERGVKLGAKNPKVRQKLDETKHKSYLFAKKYEHMLITCTHKHKMSYKETAEFMNSMNHKTAQGGKFVASTVCRYLKLIRG